METPPQAGRESAPNSTSVIANKAAFLNANIDKQLKGFKERRERNRRAALWLKITVSLLGTVVTVLLGLRVAGLSEAFSNAALIFSGLITVLNTLDTFFNYRTLWIRYTGTVNQLHALRADLDYLLLKGQTAISEKEMDDLYRRYSAILAETNETWLDIRKDQAEAGKQ